MNCPECATVLQMAERSGIEIDYCPQCRGVWLDRGELDKIIERSVPGRVPPAQAGAPVVGYQDPRLLRQHDHDKDHDDHDDDDQRRGLFGRDPRRRKREGLLGELFDW